MKMGESVHTQQTSAVSNNGDFEMIDAMLYADLDLEVKLSDAVTSLKDYKIKPTTGQGQEAAQVAKNNIIPIATNVLNAPGVAGAQPNAPMNMEVLNRWLAIQAL